ncbi:MAG TPA: hypothetical protein VH502_14095 [Actinoplanes sp.]
MSEAADAPLDEVDAAVLAELAAMYSTADPPPSDLDDRVSFAVALQHGDVELEVARLTEDLLVGAGARAADQPRTLTFDCPALTVMVTVVATPHDQRRLDGWLAPAGALVVDVRAGGSATVTHTVTADPTGRFVVEAVAAGLAQLTVHLARPGRTVVTPAVVL